MFKEKGYTKTPTRWQVPHGARKNGYSDNYTDVIHQMPHGMDESGLALEREWLQTHTHRPRVADSPGPPPSSDQARHPHAWELPEAPPPVSSMRPDHLVLVDHDNRGQRNLDQGRFQQVLGRDRPYSPPKSALSSSMRAETAPHSSGSQPREHTAAAYGDPHVLTPMEAARLGVGAQMKDPIKEYPSTPEPPIAGGVGSEVRSAQQTPQSAVDPGRASSRTRRSPRSRRTGRTPRGGASGGAASGGPAPDREEHAGLYDGGYGGPGTAPQPAHRQYIFDFTMKLSMPYSAWTNKMAHVVSGLAAAANVPKERISVKDVRQGSVIVDFQIDVVKGIRARVPQISANLQQLKRNADAGGLTLGGVNVSHMSEISEHTAMAPGAMPRRVRPASGPTVVNMGAEGHAWREFDHAVSQPAPSDTKEELLNLHAVQGWMHYHAVERRVMAAAARRWVKRQLQDHFVFWRRADVVVAALIYKRVILHGKFREMLNWWRDIRTLQGTGRRSMARAVRRLNNLSLYRSLEEWRNHAAGRLYNEHLLRGAVQRVLKQGFVRGFNTWRRNATHQRDGLAAMSTAARKLVNKWTSLGYNSLRGLYEANMRKQTKMRRTIQKLMNKQISTAFTEWREGVRTEFRQRLLLRKVTMRMMFQGLALAMYTWQDMAAEMREQQAIARRIFHRMLQRELSDAWQTWRAVCSGKDSQKQAFEAAAKRTFMVIWTKASVMFNGWREEAEMERKSMDLMRRTAAMMMNREMAMCWNQWRDTCAEQREAMEEMKRVLRHISNSELSRAWSGWADMCAEARYQREAMSRAMRGWILKEQHQAFSWLVEYRKVGREANANRNRVKRTLQRLFQRAFSSAFGTWRDNCAEVRDVRRRMMGIVNRLMQQEITAAWNIWRSSCQQVNDIRELGQRFMVMALQGKLGAAWRHWRFTSKEVLFVENHAIAAFKRWCAGKLREVFDDWRERAEELGSWQFSIATAHWAIWSTVAALMTWRVVSMQQQVATGWWDGHSMQRASWMDKIKMLKLFDGAMETCKSREAAIAYNGWLKTMRHGYERGLLEMWAIVWSSVQKIRTGIEHWRSISSGISERLAISSCSYTYWKNKAMLDHMDRWRVTSRWKLKMQLLNSEIRTQIVVWCAGNIKNSWRQWIQATSFSRASNVLLVTASRMWAHKRMSRLFTCWRKTSRRTQSVISSLKTLEGENAGQLPMWGEHKLNWGMQAARGEAPKGVGGLAYSSATLAGHDREDWAETMSRVYMGMNSPAAYRRYYLRRG